MSFMTDRLSVIQNEFQPLRTNVFEFIMVDSNGNDIRGASGPKAPSTILGNGTSGSLPNLGKKDFTKFLIEKVSLNGATISVGTHPFQNSVFPTEATPSRNVELVFRETKDMQVYRIFKNVFTTIYNPFLGYFNVGTSVSSNYYGYLGIYDTYVNAQSVSTFGLVGVFGFSKMFLVNFPSLEASWDGADMQKYQFTFAIGTTDYVSLITTQKYPDLSNFVAGNHSSFVQTGSFGTML